MTIHTGTIGGGKVEARAIALALWLFVSGLQGIEKIQTKEREAAAKEAKARGKGKIVVFHEDGLERPGDGSGDRGAEFRSIAQKSAPRTPTA